MALPRAVARCAVTLTALMPLVVVGELRETGVNVGFVGIIDIEVVVAVIVG